MSIRPACWNSPQSDSRRPAAGHTLNRRFSWCGGIAALAGLLLTGCATYSFQQVTLGDGPAAYDRKLPAEHTRRTELGLSYLHDDRLGRTDAIVLLLTPDRRVYAKLMTTLRIRDLGFRSDVAFLLRGEIDLKRGNLEETSPFDAIRALRAELNAYDGEKDVQAAYAWLSAGLARLLERWPHLRNPDPPEERLRPTLERVPAGGYAGVSIDARGILQLEYRVGEVEGVK